MEQTDEFMLRSRMCASLALQFEIVHIDGSVTLELHGNANERSPVEIIDDISLLDLMFDAYELQAALDAWRRDRGVEEVASVASHRSVQ